MKPAREWVRGSRVGNAIGYRLHAVLERHLPERRVFLRTDTDTRFLRLTPGAQLAALTGSTVLIGWTIVATSIVLMDGIGSGSLRDQAEREQAIYEERLNDLSADRDARAADALTAEVRFNEAIGQLGRMQSLLLASETRIRELESGFEIAAERTRDARVELEQVEERLAGVEAGGAMPAGGETADVLVAALDATTRERDELRAIAEGAETRESQLLAEMEQQRLASERIFEQLESAVEVSMAPLEKMFEQAGVSPDALLRTVRSGWNGQGGPLTPIMSTRGRSDPMTERANAILDGMAEIDAYREAAARLPVADPVPSRAYRQTSGFGPRRDPFGAGSRMHKGLDFAGAKGTPIHASASGRVVRASRFSGYGKTVDIDHGGGFLTRYAHLNSIDVKVGQEVSRGERIGGMGTTGRSTGVHLHYEVHRNGRQVNPMTFIKAGRDVF